jgi:hypothetical protein
MKRTPLKRIGKKKIGQGNIYSTFNKPRVKLKPVSDKTAKILREYNKLVNLLRKLCNNKSEFDGALPDWTSEWKVEPHHIGGRSGKLLLNPFNIIMLDRNRHDIEQGQIKGDKHSKQELLDIVKPLRIKQGFKEEEYKYG